MSRIKKPDTKVKLLFFNKTVPSPLTDFRGLNIVCPRGCLVTLEIPLW